MRRCPDLIAALLLSVSAAALTSFCSTAWSKEQPHEHGVFAKGNLVAWCIVPFDAERRTPERRAQMLARLGIKRLAYDWRPEHVPSFEEEILACKRHGIEFFAFWSPLSQGPGYETMMRLIQEHRIKPQIWMIAPAAAADTNDQRIADNAQAMLPFVEKAKELGCEFGLYNHGGWAGQPENMIAMVKWLRARGDTDRVGIVYNFHHGHEHLDRLADAFHRMEPYLLCVNLNGMKRDGPKILPLGQGEEDLRLLRIIHDSDYQGPIGILDHRGDVDAEQSLSENLDGLEQLVDELVNRTALETPAGSHLSSR